MSEQNALLHDKHRADTASEAIAEANIELLQKCYEASEEAVQTMTDAFAVMVGHRDSKPFSQPKEAIEAMRDVALAAIELAKLVAEEHKP